MDVTLALYIETLWEEGETRGKAGDTISGLQHRIPKLKKNLPSAWRLLSAWQRAELPARAPPLTPMLVMALVGFFLCSNQDDMAVLTWLSFHAMLRTGEALGLRAKDLHVAKNCKTGVVNLQLTKTGQRLGVQESVTLYDFQLLRLLTPTLVGWSPKTPLCSAII